MGSFFEEEGPDELYTILRTSTMPRCVVAQLEIEQFWRDCQPFLDRDLPSKAARSFRPHFWELYLAAALLDGGTALEPRSQRRRAGAGPDLKLAGEPIWIEAVAANAGAGCDRVRMPAEGEAYSVPDDQILLRLRNALENKRDVHSGYVQSGLLATGDPFVVALNAGGIPSARHELPVPRILRSVFPLGHEQVALDPATGEIIGRRIGFRDVVHKLSGAPVPTDCFFRPEYSGISAVLYACVDEVNHVAQSYSNDRLLVHNPLATAPLPRGLLPCAVEYWYDASAHTVRGESRLRAIGED